ncbi:sodium-coupled monocarboxylate transporter 2-like [Phlebotomus argentipes]|uniref:sodium-coupled monocarboxylate transporter 2-like n=1 Tax=Phlebotomus argentipes TaxID=94469 RepID=UPI002892DDEE|nr:sodium-coupled monocarboxylate transporter 2-like [Phlebotomus argentipes]
MDIVDKGQFTHLDYSFFVVVFFVSGAIGLYYAFKARKTASTIEDFLLGGRNMSIFPVIASLIATSVSGSSIVGLAAEVYTYGTHTWMFAPALFVIPLVVPTIFLPIFAELKLTSSFKYFELRFNRRVRLLASFIFLFTGLIFLPVTVYVPALSFQRVTGVNTYVTIAILSLLCASYTAIGGFKAVLWTDVVQLALMIVACIIVSVIGTRAVGGLGNVFRVADRGGRIVIANMDMNKRSSLLAYLISSTAINTFQFGLNQTILQRFLSLPSQKKMTISAWMLVSVFGMILCFSPFLGIIVYANYETCDPMKAGKIQSIDQILPHFIQEKASLFLGFNGIFIAGVFSAALSTTSSYLNAMSGVIFEDFVSNWFPNINQNIANRTMKIIVIILGILQIFLVFFIEKMGMIMQMTNQCMALNTAALLTLFVLGAVLPKANSAGAQAGALTAIVSVLTLIIGSINNEPEPTLPFRTDGCSDSLTGASNSTIDHFPHSSSDQEDIFWLFRISFMYFGFIGTFLGISIGYLTSLLTGGNTIEDQRLLAPFLRTKALTEEEVNLRIKE